MAMPDTTDDMLLHAQHGTAVANLLCTASAHTGAGGLGSDGNSEGKGASLGPTSFPVTTGLRAATGGRGGAAMLATAGGSNDVLSVHGAPVADAAICAQHTTTAHHFLSLSQMPSRMSRGMPVHVTRAVHSPSRRAVRLMRPGLLLHTLLWQHG